MGGGDFKWGGRALLAPPLATALGLLQHLWLNYIAVANAGNV